MPLIILSGLPTSGKSTRAQQLYDYLSERIAQQETPPGEGGLPGAASSGTPKYRLHLVSDDSLSISRAVYDLSPSALPAHTRSANASEKDARAALYGAVKRVLSPRDIVVLDGLNYIKGWRYQLSCEAKNVRTPHAVLQVGCSVEQAREVNERRLEEHARKSPERETTETTRTTEPYSQANWDNLVFRYEEPNGMTRWDSPLFVITWDDDEARARAVFGQIWDAVAGDGPRKDVRPNMVAVQRGHDGGGDYLYVLDRETQDVVRRVVAYQQEHDGEGGVVPIPADKDLLVHLPNNRVGLAQLQRLRRAFLGLNRGGIGLEGASKLAGPRIRQSFVDYLNDVFEKEL